MNKLMAIGAFSLLVCGCSSGDSSQSLTVDARALEESTASNPAPCDSILNGGSIGLISVFSFSQCNFVGCTGNAGGIPIDELMKLVDGDLDTYASLQFDPASQSRSIQISVATVDGDPFPVGDQVVAFLSYPPQVDVRLGGSLSLRATFEGAVVDESDRPADPSVSLGSTDEAFVLQAGSEFTGIELEVVQQASVTPYEIRVNELCANPYVL